VGFSVRGGRGPLCIGRPNQCRRRRILETLWGFRLCGVDPAMKAVSREDSPIKELFSSVGGDSHVMTPSGGDVDVSEEGPCMQSGRVAEGEAHRNIFSSDARDFACGVGACTTAEQ
jgi:hypothetical protein